MWGNVLTGAFSLEGLAERTLNGGQTRARKLAVTQPPCLFSASRNEQFKENKMTKNTTTNNYRIRADQLQNLEIDRNGRVTPRLHDLDPFQNTLLSVLYPGIKVASVNVPAGPLDDYEEAQVENALARLIWNSVHYKLVGASGSAKKGKFYFVDQEHSRTIAERFQHWPQAAIVYFGILVSPCKVMMEEPEVRVLVVPDRELGTNDCRGWIRRSMFQRLRQKHDDEILSAQVERLRRERCGKASGENPCKAEE